MQKLKVFIPILIILCFGISARLILAFLQQYITLTPDGLGYYIYGSRLFDKFTLIELIGQFRTPGYPLFIDLCMLLTRVTRAPIQSAEFYLGMNTLLYFQATIGIVGTIIIYQIMRSLSLTKNISLVISILVSINPLIIAWERTLLTESLALNLIIFIVYLYIKILNKPTTPNILLLTLSSLTLILVRPAMITLTPMLFLGIFIRHPNKYILFKLIPAFGLYISIPLFWSIYNGHMHGYPGFQVYGDVNLLGRILQLNLPIESAAKSNYLYSTMKDYRLNGGDPNPYRFLETFDPNFFGNTLKLNTLSQFTHIVIFNNLPRYILFCLPDIFKSTGEISKVIKISSVNNLLTNVVYMGQIIFSSIQTILIIYLLISILFLKFMKKHRSTLSFYSLLSIFIFALIQIIINTLLGYEDYGRLSAPIIPLLFICGGITVDYFIKSTTF
jgi:hypothetical protein